MSLHHYLMRMSFYDILMGISILCPLWIFADYYRKKDIQYGIIYVIVFYSVILVLLPVSIQAFSYRLVYFIPAAVFLFVFLTRRK